MKNLDNTSQRASVNRQGECRSFGSLKGKRDKREGLGVGTTVRRKQKTEPDFTSFVRKHLLHSEAVWAGG